MPATVKRHVVITCVHVGTSGTWSFYVHLDVPPGASDETVMKRARARAIADLDRANIETSSVEATYLEPMDES